MSKTIYTFIFIVNCLLTQQNHGVGIAIFNDYSCPNVPDNDAILYEFTKTVQVTAPYILVTPYIWHKFSASLNKQEQKVFLQKWSVYDTTIGLFLLKHKNTPSHAGIKVSMCILVKQPFNLHNTPYNAHWSRLLPSLFNIKEWHAYHITHKESSFIYISGHGSPKTSNYQYELACGITTSDFAYILKFFNDKLKINLLGIQSCYWTSKRILEVMQKKYGYKTLSYNIITPLKAETTLWITDLSFQYYCQQPTYCFYEAIKRMMLQYKGRLTQRMKLIMKNIDTLKEAKNQNQGITMVMAGSSTIEHI